MPAAGRRALLGRRAVLQQHLLVVWHVCVTVFRGQSDEPGLTRLGDGPFQPSAQPHLQAECDIAWFTLAPPGGAS